MRFWHLLVTALVAGSLTAAPLAGSTSASGSASSTVQSQVPGTTATLQDNLAADLQVMWQNLLITFNGNAKAKAELVFNFARAEATLAARDFQSGAVAAAIVPMEVYARDMAEGRAMLHETAGSARTQALTAEAQAKAAGQEMAAAESQHSQQSTALQTKGQNPVMASLIAKAAGVPVQTVLALRASGMGWAQIAAHYKLNWNLLVEAYAKSEGSTRSSGSASSGSAQGSAATSGSARSSTGASASSSGSANGNGGLSLSF